MTSGEHATTVMAELAETLRELAGKLDPANHDYTDRWCNVSAELREYSYQAESAFNRATAGLTRNTPKLEGCSYPDCTRGHHTGAHNGRYA